MMYLLIYLVIGAVIIVSALVKEWWDGFDIEVSHVIGSGGVILFWPLVLLGYFTQNCSPGATLIKGRRRG